MRQAIHIFLKDSRQLRVPIAITLAWTLLFVVTGVRPWLVPFGSTPWTWWYALGYEAQQYVPYILAGGWVLLIALAFHAEALPGDRQFWVTRPYSRFSLAAAKALFVLAYVTLPMTLAQALTLALNGLPLGPNLDGLLWEQVLITLVVTLPAAALATVTSGLTQFIWSLALAPALYFASEAVGDWHRLEWIRTTVALSVVTVFGTVVLWTQFANRRTASSRRVGLAGILMLVVAIVMLPWQTAFAIQSRVGPQVRPSVRVQLAPLVTEGFFPAQGPEAARLHLRFTVGGLPSEASIKCEAAEVEIQNAGGRSSLFQRYPEYPSNSDAASGCVFQGLVPRATREASGPTRLRATLYLTIFGPEHSERITVGAPPHVLSNGTVCASRKEAQNFWSAVTRQPEWVEVARIECRSAFGPFESTLAVERHERTTGTADSYSPFPAFLTIPPVFTDATGFTNDGRVVNGTLTERPAPAPDVVLAISRQPIRHLRVDVDAGEVNLADLDFTK